MSKLTNTVAVLVLPNAQNYFTQYRRKGDRYLGGLIKQILIIPR